MAERLANLSKPSKEGLEKYSTTEHIVGTWIDGKPLYQITFTDNQTGNINTGLTNCANAHLVDGFYTDTYGNNVTLNYYLSSSNHGIANVSGDGTVINLSLTGLSYTSRVVTIRYTKITD